MDYLSEEEKEEETQELTFDELYPEEEMDEETHKLIYGRIDKPINEEELIKVLPEKKKKKKKETKDSDNKIKTLDEVIKEDGDKNMKWKSKRATNKKGSEVKEPTISRRKLNPKLPKYNYYRKDNNEYTLINDTIHFPSL
jgi:hypothetical protein